MPDRGTTDAIFAARQVIEKHWEMQKELHLVLIDPETAYDRVPRQDVWRCSMEHGVPGKYVRLVKDTFQDARTQVKTSIGLTDAKRGTLRMKEGNGNESTGEKEERKT